MDIGLVSLPNGDVKNPTQALLKSPAVETNPEISPDGRWLAYQSDKSSSFEVYVSPFPDVNGGLWQVSNAGGSRPKWSADGRELFFLDGKNLLTAVSVAAQGAAFTFGNPRRLLDTAYLLGSSTRGFDLRAYDVSADGQRFLMIKESASDGTAAVPVAMNVVLNWQEELKTRVQPER
jgi:hypothetical protein